VLVTHEQRAVPLEHYYFLDGKLHLVQDADGRRVEKFPHIGGEAKVAQMTNRGRVFSFEDEDDDEEDSGRRNRKNGRQETSRSVRSEDDETSPAREKPKRQKPREAAEPGEVLTALRDADLLPCLYFLPGRRVVEEAAMSASLHSFTTPEEETRIREEVGIWLEQLPKEDRNLQQVISLTGLLPRGLAFHHAGLLPGLKVLVETLFARGLLRAVFATDTLALGVNMPARTVVVGSLSKFDGQEMRLLTPNEYRQLTGRAGRRGMDVHGSAVIPYSPWEPFEQSFQRITGDLLPVTSAFVIRYNSVLNLWRPGDIQHLRRICASSLREYQRYMKWELSELQRLESRQKKAQKKGKKKGAASTGAALALEKRREKIGAYPLSRAGAAELDGTVFALRTLGYIGPDDQLTLKGRLLRGIFHPAGALIVEMIMQGLLDEITVSELAEVSSWFTFNSDKRVKNRNVVHARLVQVRRQLWHIVQHVNGVEERASINLTPGIAPEFHGVALAWSRGMSLSGLMNRIDLAEGDILMSINQTIDLLQQVQAAVGQVLDSRDLWTQTDAVLEEGSATSARKEHSRVEQLTQQRKHLEHIRPLLAQASASLLHGIIVQSRTVPSMVAMVEGQPVPLDAEEDLDPETLKDPTV
jgi:superfamily II RNA helicase